jgi:signal-transduction protein with cAMP-binding, CBS, and nucleotidyltransferase domain
MRTVEDLLNQKGWDVFTVGADASVHDVISLMCSRNVGAIVVAENGAPVGIISERDCVRRVMLSGRSTRDTAISAVMTSPVRSVSLHDTVDDCMQLMTERRIRHLPVLDNGLLIGMVSVGDAVKAQLTEQEEVISGLESYIHGPSARVRPRAE